MNKKWSPVFVVDLDAMEVFVAARGVRTMRDPNEQPSAPATYTLTQQHVDAIAEFIRAAIDVANYGMYQPMMSEDGRTLEVTGHRLRTAAAAAFPVLGISLRIGDTPKKKRGRRRA